MKQAPPLSLRRARVFVLLAGVPCSLAAIATSDPVVDETLVFAEVNGLVVFEAEHFFRQELTERRAWHRTTAARPPGLTPDADPLHLAGAGGGAYLEALPDTRATHDDPLVRGENFSDEPGRLAVLSYRIHVTTPGRYQVWARVHSTGTEDNGLHFGLDGTWPESGRRWQTTMKDAWAWDSRQRTEQVPAGVPGRLYLDIATPGEHVLQLSLREDGAEVDRLLLTNDPAYVPEGTGPPAQVHRGTLPPTAGTGPRDVPRLLVLTDIGDDPDDEQSLVRLLVHANHFDLEGFVTEHWWKDAHSGRHGPMTPDGQMKLLHDALDLYGQVLPNLDRHAPGYPRADALHRIVKRGKTGIQMTLDAPKGDPFQWIGPGQDTEGSDWIIAVVDRDDPRPVDICVWGGPADLAQALLRVRAERESAEVDRFVSRLRVHAISDQDDTGPWIRGNFPKLFYILDHDPNGNKWESCYRGMFYGGDESLTSPAWIDEHVRQDHGPLGAFYPPKTNTNRNPHGALKEGDTPSWFYFYPNGLNVPAHPDLGGWGGRYVFNGRFWQDAADTVDGHNSGRASVYRWRPAFQNEFAARMDWCVRDFKDANHAPVARVQGMLRRSVQPGETVTLAATATDPDGDPLTYRWWQYADADSVETRVVIAHSDSPDRGSFVVPDEPGRQIHLILEATDNGVPALTAYQRIVCEIR